MLDQAGGAVEHRLPGRTRLPVEQAQGFGGAVAVAG